MNKLINFPLPLERFFSAAHNRLSPLFLIYLSFILSGLPTGNLFPGGFTPDFPAVCLFFIFFSKGRKMNIIYFIIISLLFDYTFYVYLFSNTLFYIIFIIILFNTMRNDLLPSGGYAALWVTFVTLYTPALLILQFGADFISFSGVTPEALLSRIAGTAIIYPIYFAFLFRLFPAIARKTPSKKAN